MTVQRAVTLSEVADSEMAEVAAWKGLPVARLMAQYLEVIHQSSEFNELLQRARSSDLHLQGQKGTE